MWRVEEGGGAQFFFAAVLYFTAVVAFLLLQELGMWLRRAEHRAWWAGSGRDLLNSAGLVAMSGSLRLVGLSWPASLLVGGTEMLILFGVTVFIATQTKTRRPRAWSLGTGVLFSVPVLVYRSEVVDLFGRIALALFGVR